MISNTAQLKRALTLILGISLSYIATGCGSPPSVAPALRMVEDTLLQEALRIASVDAARDQRLLDAARRDLEEAYRADLDHAAVLTPAWVESATTGYVAAREQLLRHELEQAAARRTRAENLRAAAHAQSRVIAVLEQQDQLMQRLGLNLWRWTPPTPESQP